LKIKYERETNDNSAREIGRFLWFSSPWEDFSMTPPYFLNFCNYLPFEQDLVLYLKKLEFPLPKYVFVPGLIEIGILILEKIFFPFKQMLRPQPTSGDHDLDKLESTLYCMSGRFHVNLSFSASVVIEKKIFSMTPTLFLHF
jgi:hypothetical protein